VKPSNAAELMAVTDVNGALVGGASLKRRFLGDRGGLLSSGGLRLLQRFQ
jgi:hypothetical protein